MAKKAKPTEIKTTRHARERMKVRRVSHDQIVRCVTEADSRRKAKHGCMRAEKVIRNRRPVVIYVGSKTKFSVITTFWKVLP